MTEFSDGDALGSLLALQGLLISAAGLLMVVMQTDQGRRVIIPRLEALSVLKLVAFSGTLVGIGSGAAWIAVFAGGSFVSWERLVIAVVALVAIATMTLVAGLLLFARRT